MVVIKYYIEGDKERECEQVIQKVHNLIQIFNRSLTPDRSSEEPHRKHTDQVRAKI